MIDILSDIHALFILRMRNSGNVAGHLVFRGDVLTNERPYQAR